MSGKCQDEENISPKIVLIASNPARTHGLAEGAGSGAPYQVI